MAAKRQKLNILKKNSDFKQVSKYGKPIKSFRLVAVVCSKDKLNNYIFDNNLPIFGITISRKIGNAVTRNLIKRRIKNILCDLHESPKLTNLAISIFARIPASNASYFDLKKDLDKIVKKITTP